MDNKLTFFSGTDTSTLKEEGTDRNNFVSLIVNNAGTYTAAITRKVTSTKTIKDCYSYEFFGEGNIENCKDYVTSSEVIEWYYLKIEKEGEDIFLNEMAQRFIEIKKAKEAKEAKKVVTTSKPSNAITTTKSTFWDRSYNREWDTDDDVKNLKIKSTNFKEPTLFDGAEDNPFEDDEDFDIPFGVVRFNEVKIQSLLLQLLTCSLIVPNESKIDIEKWATNIPQLYEKRFSTTKVFNDWADSFCEFLTWDVYDEELEEFGYTPIEMQAIAAYDLIEKLEELPQNEYIEIYIEQLQKYILM